MEKKILVLFTILVFIASCAQKKKELESFEGIIVYKTIVTTKSDNANYNEYQKQKYGSQMKLHVSKNGNFKRDFVNSGSKGYDFFMFDVSTNKSYVKFRNIDTIYASKCSTNSLKFAEEKDLDNEEILGQKCKSYFIAGIEPQSSQSISLTYFYPIAAEYINSSFYKNYEDGFYNKVTAKMESPFYKLIMELGKSSVTFDIEKIEKTTVNVTLSDLPKNIPFKEI